MLYREISLQNKKIERYIEILNALNHNSFIEELLGRINVF